MTETLKDKRAVITGAASGIGLASAALFAEEGARVALIDSDLENLQHAADKVGSGHAAHFVCDVSEPALVTDAISKAVGWLGGLDLLVNSAGVGGVGPPKRLAELSLETWDKTINTNLKGTFLVTRTCLPHLVSAGGGAIVNLVSTYAVVGGPELGAYSASKGGVLALTRTIALDYASMGVRVNALAPGFVDTPMLRRDIAKDPDPDQALADVLARIPQGELMSAEEVARVVLFLASDDAKIMTGSLLVADGGYTAR